MATNNALNIRYVISLGGALTTAGAATFAGAFPATFNFTGSTNVTFPTSGTLATVGQTVVWNNVTGTSQAMTAENGYVANNSSLVTLTLPSTAAFGTNLNIVGLGAGGWTIAQNAGQNINLGSLSTTAGTGGSLSSTNQFDAIELVCTVANTTWNVTNGPQGNITVV